MEEGTFPVITGYGVGSDERVVTGGIVVRDVAVRPGTGAVVSGVS
ncbi:MAG TPA: hypothetical protein PLI31_04855 [Methanoregulaceae archaeon]|nr:hypothetical protein [Methanoregulaceae archaeon]